MQINVAIRIGQKCVVSLKRVCARVCCGLQRDAGILTQHVDHRWNGPFCHHRFDLFGKTIGQVLFEQQTVVGVERRRQYDVATQALFANADGYALKVV